MAQPFVSKHSQHFGGAESDWRRCFDWATAVVAAYSFELGDDKFQVKAHGAEAPAARSRAGSCHAAIQPPEVHVST